MKKHIMKVIMAGSALFLSVMFAGCASRPQAAVNKPFDREAELARVQAELEAAQKIEANKQKQQQAQEIDFGIVKVELYDKNKVVSDEMKAYLEKTKKTLHKTWMGNLPKVFQDEYYANISSNWPRDPTHLAYIDLRHLGGHSHQFLIYVQPDKPAVFKVFGFENLTRDSVLPASLGVHYTEKAISKTKFDILPKDAKGLMIKATFIYLPTDFDVEKYQKEEKAFWDQIRN